MSTPSPPPTIQLGSWRYDRNTAMLRSGRHTVRLTLQQARLLDVLLDHLGEVVAREALFDHVWGDQAVEDNALARAISELRRALGDDARQDLAHHRPDRAIEGLTALLARPEIGGPS